MNGNDLNPELRDSVELRSCIGLLELCSVARGIEVADTVLWEARVELLFATQLFLDIKKWTSASEILMEINPTDDESRLAKLSLELSLALETSKVDEIQAITPQLLAISQIPKYQDPIFIANSLLQANIKFNIIPSIETSRAMHAILLQAKSEQLGGYSK